MGDKIENPRDVRQEIKQVLKQTEDKLSSEEILDLEDKLNQLYVEGLSLREVLQMPLNLTEEIYEHGYRLYNSGKYQEALNTFECLRGLDGQDKRYTFAIAATHHQLKNYQLAIANYMVYEALDRTNPFPYYYLYDCFKKIGQPLLAFDALSLASQLAGKDPQYAAWKVKLDFELAHLQPKEVTQKSGASNSKVV